MCGLSINRVRGYLKVAGYSYMKTIAYSLTMQQLGLLQFVAASACSAETQPPAKALFYSELNLNQDKAASRRQYTRYGKASQRCTGLNLIHYNFIEAVLSGSLKWQNNAAQCLRL